MKLRKKLKDRTIGEIDGRLSVGLSEEGGEGEKQLRDDRIKLEYL